MPVTTRATAIRSQANEDLIHSQDQATSTVKTTRKCSSRQKHKPAHVQPVTSCAESEIYSPSQQRSTTLDAASVPEVIHRFGLSRQQRKKRKIMFRHQIHLIHHWIYHQLANKCLFVFLCLYYSSYVVLSVIFFSSLTSHHLISYYSVCLFHVYHVMLKNDMIIFERFPTAWLMVHLYNTERHSYTPRKIWMLHFNE